MSKPVVQRLLLLIPVLFGISLVTFLLMHVSAEDAVDVMYRQSGAVSESVKAATRTRLGLDRPLLVQYALWLRALFLGTSLSIGTGLPVSGMILAKLPATLALTF